MSRVLETVLTGRNLLSPVLATASRDVVAFNSTVAGANEKAAASSAASARVQQASASSMAAASGKAATASTTGAAVQSGAADKIAASNVKASTSASASAQQQTRAHTQAAQSATLNARIQETANRSLAASNGLLGTSLTPLTAGLGGTALALGYAGYRGMEFGTAMSQVQAASQETGATLEQLRDAAVEAGADTQYSAVEAAQGITEMSKAGVQADDILRGGLTGALNLAAAGQISVAEAAETGATALSVFRLEGSQMSHVADLLAAGAGKAQGSVGDLSAALNQSALVASQAGLSVEDTAGALAMFASNGLIGSDAGTSFKTMLQALTPNSEKAAKVMADMGLSAFDAQGNFVGLEAYAGQLQTALAGLTEEQRNTTLETIFGSDAVRAASVLYKEGSAGVRQWAKDTNDAGYAQRQASQLTDNLRGDLERLGGAFDSTMTTIGSGAQGALREAVQALTAIVNVGGDVLGFFNDLPGPIQAGIVALAGVAALKGPVSGAIDRISASVLGWSLANDGAAASTGRLRAAGSGLMAFFGGPWGLAITGAAIGLSLLVDWLGKADEATEGASEAQMGLTAALEASKGAIDANVRAAAAKAAQDAGILDSAKRLHIPLSLVTDAILGQGNALNEAGAKFLAYRDARVWGSEADQKAAAAANESWQALLNLAGQTEGSIASAQDLASATAETGAAMAATTARTEEDAKALEDWLNTVQDVLGGYVDPLATYKGLLDEKTTAEREAAEKTAASTEDSSDSWKDYVTDVGVSLDEYAAKLEEQLTAQANWRDNIVAVTQAGGLEVGQILLGMGEEGAGLVQQMVDAIGTDEFPRLRDLMIREAQAGGAGAAAALDNSMKLMAIVGRDGASATRSAIAKELGLSVTDVQRIADQYGLNLATGINPLLRSLGKPVINMDQQAGRRYNGVTEFSADGNLYEQHQAEIAPGGAWRVWAEPETGGEAYIPLAPAKRDRSMDIWRETGKRLGAPEARYFAAGGFVTAADVPRPYSTDPYRPPISTGADATMQKGFDEVRAWLTANAEATQGGTAGTGAVGGAWGSLWQLVKSQIPQARINSTYRAGDPGYHGRGKAIDFGFGTGPGGAGSAGLASINRLLHDSVGRNLAELIYDGIGDDRPDLKNGRPLTYSAATRAQHRNHVHAAVADTGGVMASGTAHLNLSGSPERTLSPQQTEAFERWLTGPAAMPGYGMGGGRGGSGTPQPVVVSLAGATVTGRFEFGSDGLVTLVDGRIDGALTELHDTIHYAGG